MNSLRWTLVTVTVLAFAGFVALAILGGGFRRSFGASDNAPWLIALPLLVMLAFLASLLAPGNRLLLHSVAVLALSLAGACLWIFQESMFLGVLGLTYVALWLVYYRLTG